MIALWLALSAAGAHLDEGSKALAEFRPQEALALLERAKGEGPYDRERYILLYRELGIAHAYLGHTEESESAFEMMLALDPERSISYTLSPKVTFPFERAREASQKRGAPAIDVRWPSDLLVGTRVPIDVEVVADPFSFLASATLFVRPKGAPDWTKLEVALPPPGRSARAFVPTADPGHASALEVYLVARDKQGDEVYTLSSPARPREIQLGWEAPDPWYGRWWVWTIVAGVVAAGTAGGVLAAKHEPSRIVGGSFRVE